MFQYDPLVFLRLLLYLRGLLSVILCLSLYFRASILKFVALIGQPLIALLVPLNLPFHILIGRHLLCGLAPQLCQFRIPLPCHVIQTHVPLLQPRIVSLRTLYLQPQLTQLLS